MPKTHPCSCLPAILLIAATATLAACGGTQTVAQDCPPAAEPCAHGCAEPPGQGAHSNLNAVAWLQTATEAQAIQQQTFADAIDALGDALADPSWSAAPEQVGDFGALPPAVIVDVDETMLDNSAYQAHLVQTGTEYANETWDAWCVREQAQPVPGAAAFVAAAEAHGVTVFYVTNRNARCEAATVNNLAAHGMVTDAERVLTRDESSTGSAKGERRASIATSYRVLLLVGDNLGDFVDGYNADNATRAQLLTPYAGWWGTRWFMLPNPTYGSWVNAIAPSSGTTDEQLRGALRVWLPGDAP